MSGLAQAVSSGESAHATADDEDVELVWSLSAIVEGGVQGSPFSAGSAVSRDGRQWWRDLGRHGTGELGGIT